MKNNKADSILQIFGMLFSNRVCYNITQKFLTLLFSGLAFLLLMQMTFAQEDRNRNDRDRGSRERWGDRSRNENERERGNFPGGGFPGNRPGGFPGGGAFPGGGFPGNRPGGFPGGGVFPGGGFPGNRPGEFPGGGIRERGRGNQNTSAPLVPGFGEIVELSSVLKFGEQSAASNLPVQQNSGDDRQRQINEQAQQQLNRYDKDKNGRIEKSTGEWNNIRLDVNAIDINRDGKLTLDEMKVYVGNQLRGGTGGAKAFTTYATTYQYMPEGIPPWFTDNDKDNDGQLTLLEYSAGQPITDIVISEFEFLDVNNDGVATLNECYDGIKAKEELDKKKREEQQANGGQNNDPNRRDPRSRFSSPSSPRERGGENASPFTPSANPNRDNNSNSRERNSRSYRSGNNGNNNGNSGGNNSRPPSRGGFERR
ncbi:MAG: hypothetical protein LBT05_06295 [Planctomycetaceae bacterium]|jgi:hypothetical protein|nr:hypothetical protein [Planctomycetaceae bacterium]